MLTYTVSTDLRLPPDAYLLGDLLGLTRFFKDLLTVRGEENRESAVAEFTRILQNSQNWNDADSSTLLRSMLTTLSTDQNALTRLCLRHNLGSDCWEQ